MPAKTSRSRRLPPVGSGAPAPRPSGSARPWPTKAAHALRRGGTGARGPPPDGVAEAPACAEAGWNATPKAERRDRRLWVIIVRGSFGMSVGGRRTGRGRASGRRIGGPGVEPSATAPNPLGFTARRAARSQKRSLRQAATKPPQSAPRLQRDEALVEAAGDARLLEERRRRSGVGDELPVCAAASATKSRAAGSVASRAAPSSDGQDRDGVEEDRRAALELLVGVVPGAVAVLRRRRPPARRASASPPRPSAPSPAPRGSSASTPSVTSAPTLRPAKLLGPFLTMLSAGDGFRSCAGRPGGGRPARASPSAAGPRPPSRPGRASMFSRCETIRARIAGVSTLLSSNVRALAMCCLLDRRSG